MTTAVADRITDIPVLGEDEVCHIRLSGRTTATVCGAPYNCTGEVGHGGHLYTGQEICADCQRQLCPECRALVGKT